MEEYVDVNNKDSLVQHIIDLRIKLSTNDNKLQEETSAIKGTVEKKDSIQKEYERVKLEFDAITKLYYEKSRTIRDLERLKGIDTTELKRLQRAYDRLMDKERVNEAYLTQVEAFRNKCSEAPWRAENRTDGQGAMPHQIEGAIHLAVARRALLGDKRGLGKSLTSIIYCDLVEAAKVIAIVPGDTVDNFIQEIKLWTPHRRVVKLKGMPKGQRDFVLSAMKNVAQFTIVVNYEAWRKDKDLINDLISLNADTLILDEAQNANKWDTQTSTGIRRLRFGLNVCPSCRSDSPNVTVLKSDSLKAKCGCGHTDSITEFCSIVNVVPMSGSLILNRPQELFPNLFLIAPDLFPSESVFLRDYCLQIKASRWAWMPGGEKRLTARIGPRIVARDRKAAGVNIPPPKPMKHIITWAEMEENYPKQVKAYEQARDHAELILDPDRRISMTMPKFVTLLLRLRQVTVWPAAIELSWDNPETGIKEVTAKLDVHESAKLDLAQRLIGEITEEGDRAVVFSKFNPGLHELYDRLGNSSCVYNGSTADHVKKNIQQDFDARTAPEKPIWNTVLANYQSGGVGLNFTGANEEIILDPEWNPGKEDQAIGRIDRIGQTKETRVHFIIIENTVDKFMYDLLEHKRNMIDGFEKNQAELFAEFYDRLKDKKA